MIVFDRLWVTMKEQGISKYKLIQEYKISSGQLDRLRKGGNISTYTLNQLCKIFTYYRMVVIIRDFCFLVLECIYFDLMTHVGVHCALTQTAIVFDGCHLLIPLCDSSLNSQQENSKIREILPFTKK